VSGRVSMAIVLSLASTPRRETCVIYFLASVDESILGQIGVNASPIGGLAGARTSQVLDGDSDELRAQPLQPCAVACVKARLIVQCRYTIYLSVQQMSQRGNRSKTILSANGFPIQYQCKCKLGL
jgi:hypothetical protein